MWSSRQYVLQAVKFGVQLSLSLYLIHATQWKLVALGIIGFVDSVLFPIICLSGCKWPYYFVMSVLMFVFGGLSVTHAAQLSLATVVIAFLYGTGLFAAFTRAVWSLRRKPVETHVVDGMRYEILVDGAPLKVTDNGSPLVAPL